MNPSLTQSHRGGPASPISHRTSWEACGSWSQVETETTSAYGSLLYANCSLRQQESAKAKDRPEPTPWALHCRQEPTRGQWPTGLRTCD